MILVGSHRTVIRCYQLIAPTFSLAAVFSLALPLTLLALISQNAPAISILRANGYRPPTNVITLLSGLGSVVTAPLLGHGLLLGGPMTALCAGPEVHPDPNGRYVAAVSNGICMIAFGVVGATVVSLVQALPTALVGVVAGLALLPVLLQAFRLSIGQCQHTLAVGFALLIAASDLSLLGISSSFWAIVAGLAVARFLR